MKHKSVKVGKTGQSGHKTGHDHVISDNVGVSGRKSNSIEISSPIFHQKTPALE
jgi:hypothetical protein